MLETGSSIVNDSLHLDEFSRIARNAGTIEKGAGVLFGGSQHYLHGANDRCIMFALHHQQIAE